MKKFILFAAAVFAAVFSTADASNYVVGRYYDGWQYQADGSFAYRGIKAFARRCGGYCSPVLYEIQTNHGYKPPADRKVTIPDPYSPAVKPEQYDVLKQQALSIADKVRAHNELLELLRSLGIEGGFEPAKINRTAAAPYFSQSYHDGNQQQANGYLNNYSGAGASLNYKSSGVNPLLNAYAGNPQTLYANNLGTVPVQTIQEVMVNTLGIDTNAQLERLTELAADLSAGAREIGSNNQATIQQAAIAAAALGEQLGDVAETQAAVQQTLAAGELLKANALQIQAAKPSPRTSLEFRGGASGRVPVDGGTKIQIQQQAPATPSVGGGQISPQAASANTIDLSGKPFLRKFCGDCHGPNGAHLSSMNLSAMNQASVDAAGITILLDKPVKLASDTLDPMPPKGSSLPNEKDLLEIKRELLGVK